MINPATTFAISRFLGVNFDRGIKFHLKLFSGKSVFRSVGTKLILWQGRWLLLKSRRKGCRNKSKKKTSAKIRSECKWAKLSQSAGNQSEGTIQLNDSFVTWFDPTQIHLRVGWLYPMWHWSKYLRCSLSIQKYPCIKILWSQQKRYFIECVSIPISLQE